MKKLSNFLWGSLGVLLFAALVYVVVMFSIGKWSFGKVGKWFDSIFSYGTNYEKVVTTDTEFMDNNIKDIIKDKNAPKIVDINDFQKIEYSGVNNLPFTNWKENNLTMYYDEYYSLYRFTYNSDYNGAKFNAYILTYRDYYNEKRSVTYGGVKHNEILAFGTGFGSLGQSNLYGSNSINGIELKQYNAGEITAVTNNENNTAYYYKGFNVFDILKSFALATRDITKLEAVGFTNGKAYCSIDFPFLFGNENELYRIKANVIYQKGYLDSRIKEFRKGYKPSYGDHYIQYDLCAKVYKDIYFDNKPATNILLFDDSDINNFKLIKNGNCSIFNKGV